MTSYLEQFRTILATGQPWRGFSPAAKGRSDYRDRWVDAVYAAKRACPNANTKIFVRADEVNSVRMATGFAPASTTTAIQAGYIGLLGGYAVFTDELEPPERRFIRRSAVVVADFVVPESPS